MDLDPTTFASMTPEEFARLVTGMSDTEVAAQLRGEHRVGILDAIFGRMPELFRPDRAKGVSAVTHFRITGGPEDHPDDTYEIVVDDGTCALSEAPGEAYDVSLMMGPAVLMRLVTGRINPTIAVMRGKITVRGDLALASRFSSFFDMPKG